MHDLLVLAVTFPLCAAALVLAYKWDMRHLDALDRAIAEVRAARDRDTAET